jgi:hypothetical protein
LDLTQSLSVAFKVLADWRVLFTAVAVMALWSALRYVGSVYHRRPKVRPRPPAAAPGAASPGAASGRAGRAAARAGRSEGPEDDSDSGMIE